MECIYCDLKKRGTEVESVESTEAFQKPVNSVEQIKRKDVVVCNFCPLGKIAQLTKNTERKPSLKWICHCVNCESLI